MSGFDIEFLGEDKKIDLPKLKENLKVKALNDGQVYDFTHFSLVMNKKLRSAIYVAYNIDKKSEKGVRRHNYWHYDERIGEENQIGDEYYKNNSWDRGHMARRKSICWGDEKEAEKANYDSFCWANISLQHKDINQGSWSELEQWVYEKLPDNSFNEKISIFVGPINGEDCIEYCGENKPLDCGIMIPIGFWKVICYIDKDNNLKSISFIIKQQRYFKTGIFSLTDRLKIYQVSIMDIINKTDIIFDKNIVENDIYYNGNLIKSAKILEPKLILTSDDIKL